MLEQVAPEPGAPDLAEKMARAWHEHVAHVPWEQMTGKDRLVAVAERRLRAFRAAGLAVVELPEWERLQGSFTGWGGSFGPVTAHVDDDGSVDIRIMAGRMSIAKAESAGAALIAASRWARSKGGDLA